MGMFRNQSLLFVLLFILVVPTVDGEDLQDSRTQLNKIQQRIENAQIDLSAKKKSEVQFSRQLALLNRTLQQLDKRISELKKQQSQVRRQVEIQRQQIATAQKKIQHTGRRLQKRLVALYKEGDIGPLKILFSADSPTELVQQYHYLTRVMEYDRELLGDYRSAVDSHQQQLVELESLNQQQTDLLAKEQQQKKTATDGRRLHSRLLKQVKTDRKLLNQELSRLQEKAKRLQLLITRLKERPQPEPPPSTAMASFSAGKGKLPWPVLGEVLIGFGTKKDAVLGAYYESNGIELAIPAGTPIHAVAAGKVVFSAWFKGYGNLLILSHVGGFHTLYAQADQLDKVPGDQVSAGDVVAKSGLDGRDSIYFEIRKDGSPVNPLSWLQRR